ncbi:InlB B-repeat-containing protein [Bifidobacterium longum]|uniref:InlB B-repeat-containing protein n=1 Tax=Bifidobacterium longum TaxID=216816 RepID=UPI000ABDC95D|nr:InlB B-repeat-containing protein [Bifidobacterium longum]
MHSILKRSAALIASAATLLGGGMLMAGTAQADGIGLPVMTIHPAASTSYPKELVNGGFQTFGNRIVDKRSGGWQYLSFVDGNGMAMEGSSEQPWAKVDGWDAVKFGWKSNDSVSGHRGIVEVQRFRTAVKGSTGNVWGEIAAATQGKYLYQDIDTANTSDAMYTVRLKHASRNKDARDSMQVLVGAPGREKPVTMRRTIANAGDKAGEESTTITSTGTGQDDQWDTYEGTVLVPRGQDVTRFTFKSVADSNSAGRPDSAEGNLIDDVVFTKAYQLTYDANGGVKTRTSQIDYTTGGGTRGKVKTVRDSPAPPAGQEKIVNGDFEYSGTGAGLSDSPFNYVSLSRKSYYYKDSRNVNHRVALPAGFDAKRFAWKSDQTGKDLGNPPYEQAGDVQVWNRYDGSNHYAELTAAQAGSAIYQDIDTESDSDVQYIVSLRHASLNASHLDSMQVLIGAPGHETPVTMTRVTANGYGDKVGESSDTIATRVSNPKPADREDSDHTGQWETYTGTVTVPAGRPVTRFTFRNVSSKSAWNGNLIDDIAFTKARRLDYDANGGTKAQASQIGYRTDATQGAVETVASKTLPTELVNGSFDYLLDGGWDTISPVGRGGYADDRGWGRFTSVDPASGEYIQNAGQNPATFDSTGKWVKWPGFDAAKFGWASDQKGGQPQGGVGLTDRPNAVELQQDSVTGNTYAEIVGSERGKAILQKIDTQHDSDTVYTVRFDHASLSKEHADSMQVLVNGKPVTMTRVTSNKAGDEQGWTGTSITTHATNTNRFQHDGQWATYEGKVTIPANTPVSTFTFKALNAVDPTKGNLIDNLTFKIAYRLSYDSNGGTKKQASRISSKTFGKAKTARTEAIASRASGDELAVNGGFDTPKWTIAKEGQGLPWVYVTPNAGTIRSYAQAMAGQTGVKAGGLTAATFAWQDLDAIGSIQNFELHREKDGNTAADVHAGRTVAQTVNTTPGASYTFSIRHSGRSKGNAGGVTLLTGPDKDHLTPVRLTRTTVSKTGQKYGDKTGDVGTVAYTHSDSMDATEGSHDPWDHSDDWESYEGTVIIPAGQSRTMIAYRGVAKDGTLTAAANDSIIDDLSFRLAYKLSYDANGGAKKSTSQIKASSDGTVKSIADKTSKVPVHDLEDTDVPGQYRDFILDTTKVKFSDVKFENGAWLNAPMPDSGDGATAMFPLKIGASATLPNVGEWTDGGGHTHSINAVISLHSWNGGSISQLWTRVEGELSTRKDLFWINTVGRNFDLPAQVIKALGGIDTSKRVGCQWTVNFTYEDGTPVPDTFRGVTGFNDLDGWDAQPDLKFEGVQLVSGFDGAYKTRDAELATYGVNGFAGAKHDSGPESNLDGKQQVKHRLAATWTGSSFTFGYDLQNPEGRDRGSRMTFGVPVTRTQVLTYKANGGTGQVPSHTEAGKVESASVKTAGSVHAISDATDTTGSAEGKAVSGVLTDTTVDAGDGTSQRTITRSDGSVRVETIADTGAVSGCQVYYPAGVRITLATAKADSDCWDSSQISKTNRTFYGWSANTDANDKDVPVADTMDRATLDANAETQITMPARAKTVYALWAINPTLTYDVNAPAGTNAPVAPASKTVPYNTAATDTSGWVAGDAGKITGYTFQGWYTGKDGAAKYDFTAKLTSDATVYAKWTANACTVKYDAGGGQGSMPDQKFTFGVPQNLTRNTFTRSGWAFTGWKRADTGDAYQDGQQVANLICTPNGGAPFVAQWTPNAAAINYNANPPAGRTAGGQGTANWTGHTGDTQAIGANGWTLDGYTFIGWNTSADGKGTAYAPGTTWTANGTLTLYAQWTPGQAGLTYDGNGATGGKTDPQPGKTDEKINVRDNGFTRDGYTFVTWNTQAGCKGKAVDPGDEWTLQGSGTLYACWAGTVQNLAYHGNGATGGNTAVQSGKTGDELTTNANGFTRDGYTFVRWDTAKDGSGTAYGEGKNGVSQYTMKPAGNDLYAIWKANPASIVYRNGYPNTTGSTPDTTGSTGDTVTVSQNGFDRPGYTFTGWSTSKRGDPSLNPGDKHTLEPGTTTVWAQWKANPAHLVYNSNIGGIGSETRTVDGVVDQTVKTIGNPFDRPGYTFSGWNTQADGKGKAYDPGADCTLTANDKSTPKNTSVLYAQWTINKVTLKFDPNGGVGGYPSINTDAFGSVTIPKDAKEPKVTRPGFRFTGWSLKKTPDKDETLLTPGKDTVSMPAEGEVTVYAQWEPAMTTLPFTGGNAQIPTIWLWAGLAFLIIAAGAFSPMIRLRMGAGSKGRHAGTPTIGRHSR